MKGFSITAVLVVFAAAILPTFAAPLSSTELDDNFEVSNRGTCTPQRYDHIYIPSAMNISLLKNVRFLRVLISHYHFQSPELTQNCEICHYLAEYCCQPRYYQRQAYLLLQRLHHGHQHQT